VVSVAKTELDSRDSLVGRSLAIYLPDLSGGGIERLHLGLAPAFIRAGLKVTFLLDRARGELIGSLPPGVEIVALGADRQLEALPRLIRYLRIHEPDLLVASMDHMNVMALLARRLSRGRTHIIATQHSALSEQAKRPGWRFKLLPLLYRAVLPQAARIVAVSRGVAVDMARIAGISGDRISVIYNGAITDDFDSRLAAAAAHPWLNGDRPLVIAVGRIVPEKDYPTLLRAFGEVVRTREARLLILGEGPLRANLTGLVAQLGLGERVAMPGYVPNPLPYMVRANALVLSSRFEGFGLVLAEALACGTPVVSTDCPHGPSEILDGGRYGPLVPVANPAALARAIASVLDAPPDREFLAARGRSFSLARCAAQYLDLYRSVLGSSADVLAGHVNGPRDTPSEETEPA
jgi:glycosyltransferase involved in cell wall biosynthesis